MKKTSILLLLALVCHSSFAQARSERSLDCESRLEKLMDVQAKWGWFATEAKILKENADADRERWVSYGTAAYHDKVSARMEETGVTRDQQLKEFERICID